MRVEDVPQLDPDKNPCGWHASYVLESFESRFPDLLTNEARLMLWLFINDALISNFRGRDE